MKQLIKYVSLLFALVLAASIIGGCLTAGVAVVQMIVEKAEVNGMDSGEGNDIWHRTEDGDVVFLGLRFGSSNEIKSGSETFNGADITSMELECLSGELIVEVWENDTISVTYENISEDYEIKNVEGTLIICREDRIFSINRTFNKISKFHVQIPKSLVFQNVIADKGSGSMNVTGISSENLRLDSGSGSVHVSDIKAGVFKVDSGSGAVLIENATAERTVVDSGSGAVRMKNSDLGETSIDAGSGLMNLEEVTTENLVVDSGSGRLDYTGYLVGNCVFDTASGTVSLNIYGAEEDYNIRADLGSGGFYINGDKEKDTEIEHAGAENLLIFDAGSGKVSVNFVEGSAIPEELPEAEQSSEKQSGTTENYDRTR